MEKALLQMFMVSLAGTTVMVAGLSMPVAEIMDRVSATANAASVQQLRVALELYYSDHQGYPEVSGGAALIEALAGDDYILQKPFDPSAFRYEVSDSGQNYTLALQ